MPSLDIPSGTVFYDRAALDRARRNKRYSRKVSLANVPSIEIGERIGVNTYTVYYSSGKIQLLSRETIDQLYVEVNTNGDC